MVDDGGFIVVDSDFIVVDSDFIVVTGDFIVVTGDFIDCALSWNRFTLELDNPVFCLLTFC